MSPAPYVRPVSIGQVRTNDEGAEVRIIGITHRGRYLLEYRDMGGDIGILSPRVIEQIWPTVIAADKR